MPRSRYLTSRCDVCGRYVDLADPGVVYRMVTPDSAYTIETWETYHRACEVHHDDTIGSATTEG